jgi:hypothetical protein
MKPRAEDARLRRGAAVAFVLLMLPIRDALGESFAAISKRRRCFTLKRRSGGFERMG